MAFDTGLRVGIDPSGARAGGAAVRQELQGIGREARGTTQQMAGSFDGVRRTIFAVRNAVAALAGAMAVRQFVQFADTATQMEARLRLVTSSATELALVQERLFQTAQDTRGSFEGTVQIFGRLAQASSELGVSNERLLGVVETINQAITVSGSSANEAGAALIQLSQGIAAGALRGEELNSVLEQTPRLARAIAEGMGVSVGKLREMGQEGELTAERVIGALEDQAAAIAREFGMMERTVGQAMMQLRNDLVRVIGVVNEGSGATEVLTERIDDLREIITSQAFQTGFEVIVGAMAGLAGEAGRAVAAVGQLVELFRNFDLGDLGEFLLDRTGPGWVWNRFFREEPVFEDPFGGPLLPGEEPDSGRRGGGGRGGRGGGGGGVGGDSGSGADVVRDIEEAIRVLRLRNIEQQQLNEALRRGRGEFEALEQVIDLEREAVELGIDSSSDLGREWIELAREGQQLKNTFDELMEAQQNNERATEALTRRHQQLREEMQLAQVERGLVGANRADRAAGMAEAQARLEVDRLRQEGQVDPVAAQRYIEAARGAARYRAETERIADSHREMEMIGERAFDRIGSAMVDAAVEGGDAWKNMGNVINGVLASIAADLSRLAFFNPILNEMLGGDRPTIGGGGGGGGILGSLLGGVGSTIGGWLFGGGGGIGVDTSLPSSFSLGTGFDSGLDFSMGGGGFSLGSGFGDVGGFFASGGRPPVGMPSVVGERGPELWVPDAPGRIIPNHALGASGGPSGASRIEINVNVSGARGNTEIRQMVNEGVAEGIARAAPDIQRGSVAMARDDFEREGLLSVQG